MELIAVKKKSETIATLPFSVISVLFPSSEAFVMFLIEFGSESNDEFQGIQQRQLKLRIVNDDFFF